MEEGDGVGGESGGRGGKDQEVATTCEGVTAFPSARGSHVFVVYAPVLWGNQPGLGALHLVTHMMFSFAFLCCVADDALSERLRIVG